MSMTRRAISALIVGLLCAGSLVAQEQEGSITGRVTDAMTLQPISNANVFVEGLMLGAVTTPTGTFVISGVPVGTQQVRASLIGYAPLTQEVTVTAGEAVTINFELQIQAVVMEELVTTGYGTQRRLAITGSVATVDAPAADVGVTSNVNDMLQGRVAGLLVTRNTGEPGSGQQIRIRGGTSLSASNEPLYVIDGVPLSVLSTESTLPDDALSGAASLPRSPLNLINPSDIEKITILKDAAAAAIYGSRGANGVILIETKQGALGTVSFEYDGYAAVASAAGRLNVLSGNEYRAFIQDQVSAGVFPASRLEELGSANTNWEDEVTRTAVTQNHNLTFTGGTQATRFRASLNYMDQNGIVRNNGFERFQGRLNGTHSAVDDRLRLDLRLTSSRVENNYLPFQNTGGFEGAVFNNMVQYNPTFPVSVVDPETNETRFFELGAGVQSLRNPVAAAEQIEDFATTTRTLGSLTTQFDVLSSLTAQVTLGVDASSSVRRTYLPASNPIGAQWNGRALQRSRDRTDLTIQTLLTLDQPIGIDHRVEVVGGFEGAEYGLKTFEAEARNFLTDAFSFGNLRAGGERPIVGSYEQTVRFLSGFGRANYSFKDRYFLTGVIRVDGASQFGEGNKWSTFPAISASWRISEEEFMADGPFSELRVRGGWGKQGQPAVPPYSSLVTLESQEAAQTVFGEESVVGVAATRNANPDLKWEETEQWNVAIDFGFADNRIAGTLEVYQKDTDDLLLEVDVPQPASVTTRLENVGKVRNRGFEASLDALLMNRPNLNWSAGLVFDLNRNEVVDLGGRTFISNGGVSGQGQSGQISQRLIPGEPVGTFWGPQYVGVDDQGRQLFNQYDVTRDEDGNEISRELIGTTLLPTGDDFVIIGDANPDFTFGLNNRLEWGRFDASVLLLGQIGHDVFNNTALVYSSKSQALTNSNFIRDAINDPIGVREPAIFSDRWIEDGSFVRLQNLTLGYTFEMPAFASGRQARVYASADNLFLITGYSGLDPEVFTRSSAAGSDLGGVAYGIDYLSYPRARTFTFGVRFEF